MKSGKFTFSVDSSLLFQLGERLVTKPSIALAELVKNAYDADATEVNVTLEDVGQPGGAIIVKDNGHGMTFEEMQNSWMRIATTGKRDNPISRIYCRPITGAKGIGRFAARRLGDKLELQTIAERPDGIKENVIVSFDWERSFKPNKDLNKVPVTYTRQRATPESDTGVCLLIKRARDAWTKDEIVDLRRDLLSLQSPFPDLTIKTEHIKGDGCQRDPGFNFKLTVKGSDELEKLSGELGKTFLEAAWARLDGRVDKKGIAHYAITMQKTDERDNLTDTSNDYTGLKNVRFRIYFMIYRQEYFEESDFGVRDAQRKGREEGGVRVYLGGFRVFPYGEPGDDWLQLDKFASGNITIEAAIEPPKQVKALRKSIPGRPFLLIPKNNQLFGAVAISQTKHPDIEINVTRDRLIETPTVMRLRHFVQNGIYWMTLKYAAYLAEQRTQEKKNKAKSADEIIEETKEAIENSTEIPEEIRRAVVFNLASAVEMLKIEAAERISEISMLRVLASAGTTLSLMNHQLQALIGTVLQAEQDLIRLRPEIPEKIRGRYDDIRMMVSEWREMVELQVSQLGFLLSPDSRQRRRRHALYEVVENVRKPMSYYMKKYGVDFENNVPRNLRTPPVYQSELYSVLINILSNALKAVHGQSKREIAVEAGKVDGVLYIRMKDTGRGLPAERREISFKPFVTTSIPNPVLGVGTGLGLKVVRDILEMYEGTARFIDVKEPWKTCIEIVLPDRGNK